MTNYGPPGGGSPGPWRGHRPDETRARPAQQPYPPSPEPYPPAGPSYPSAPPGRPGPYGGGAEPPYGREPGPPYEGSYQPAPAGPAYGGQPYALDDDRYGDEPPPSRRGRGPLIAVLAVVLLLVVAAGAAFWLGRERDEPAPAAAPTSPAAASEPSADTAAPTSSAAAPESSADPRFAKVGQCVRNDGVAGGKPKLLISGCAAKSYQVLSRIDGPTSGERDAEAKCAKVEGYTNWYFFDSELDTLDFVLCLKQR
ncbi:flagellar basal body protein FliL [Micromonospora sp. STR1s_6]|uniref:Flagellar basal body protein FliL n=1 Tax=Micromonospora tarensis TaxID=2806100 RepID=A0ABS1YF65_9ACTN|nr:flagellar basal body protein FliL [Micromonospora tarensis]